MELGNPAAERGVLSGIFNFGSDAFVDVSDLVTPSSFLIDSNQLIYKCFEQIFTDGEAKTTDLPTVLATANQLGFASLSSKSEVEHMRAIANFPIKQENIRRLAGTVRKLEIARLLTSQLEEARFAVGKVTGEESLTEILSKVEGPLFDFTSLLAKTDNDGPQAIGDTVEAYIAHLEANPCEQLGISTPYPIYDEAIGGGYRKRTVNFIAARPGSGKTTLADNISLHVGGTLGCPVLNLDSEMSLDQRLNRMLANLSGIGIKEVETGKFASNAYSKKLVKEAGTKLKSIPYDYVSIAGNQFEDTIAQMRRWVLRKVGLGEDGLAKPCLIVYDYMKLMDTADLKSGLQEYQMIGFMTTALHNFAVKYGVPILVFVQLSREFDVSQSDRILWLCSTLGFFKPKDDDEIAIAPKAGNRMMEIKKARHGAGLERPGDYINFHFNGKIARITEGKTRDQQASSGGGFPVAPQQSSTGNSGGSP